MPETGKVIFSTVLGIMIGVFSLAAGIMLGSGIEVKRGVMCPLEENSEPIKMRCDRLSLTLNEVELKEMPHRPESGEVLRCDWSTRTIFGSHLWLMEKPVCTPHTMYY